MKFDDLAETCELENKQTPPVDPNAAMLNDIADKVESVISSKIEEFNKTVNPAETTPINKTVNPAETTPINNSGEAANNDNAGDSTGNNNDANGSAESE